MMAWKQQMKDWAEGLDHGRAGDADRYRFENLCRDVSAAGDAPSMVDVLRFLEHELGRASSEADELAHSYISVKFGVTSRPFRNRRHRTPEPHGTVAEG